MSQLLSPRSLEGDVFIFIQQYESTINQNVMRSL